jgi:hypothetical protein
MATYVNNLRLKEIATGDESGTWGTSTNTNLELIGEALGIGTEAITTNANTHTTTVADGSSDAGRAIYLKYTGALDSDCTITIGPNTMKRVHIIENATTDSGSSGPYNIIISQGSGSNVTIANGKVAVVQLDGAGSGAAVLDAFTDLQVTDSLSVNGTTLTIGDATAEDTKLVFDGNAQDYYIGLDDSADDLVIGLGSAVGTTPAIEIDENQDIKFAQSIGVGQAASSTTGDIVAQTMSLLGTTPTLTLGDGGEEDVAIKFNGVKDFYIANDDSADKLVIGEGSTVGTNNILTITDDSVTIGDGAAVDSKLVFDGNAQDFYIGLDDSADDLVIGVGSTVGTTPAIIIDENQNVGIGVAPGQNFNLEDTGAVEARFRSTDNDCFLQISSDTDEGQDSVLQFLSGTSARGSITYDHNTTAASQSMIFKTGDNAVSAMTIQGDGKVGIGSGTIDEMIHVQVSSGDAAIKLEDASADFIRIDQNSVGANDKIRFKTGSSLDERARITADGQLLVGKTSGTSGNAIEVNNRVSAAAGSASQPTFNCEGDTNTGMNLPESDRITLSTGGTERVRVNADGNMGIGSTGDSTHRLSLVHGTGATRCLLMNAPNAGLACVVKNDSGTGAYDSFAFTINGGSTQVGGISSGAGGTAFNTSSDYRLKENVDYTWDATTRLKQLKPARFNWISDSTDTLVDGFLAHEVEDIVPEAITGTKDATETLTNVVRDAGGLVLATGVTEAEWIAGKEDDTPDYPSDSTWDASLTKNIYQQIDQAKLVPLLVKTIQELEARITTLESA